LCNLICFKVTATSTFVYTIYWAVRWHGTVWHTYIHIVLDQCYIMAPLRKSSLIYRKTKCLELSGLSVLSTAKSDKKIPLIFWLWFKMVAVLEKQSGEFICVLD